RWARRPGRQESCGTWLGSSRRWGNYSAGYIVLSAKVRDKVRANRLPTGMFHRFGQTFPLLGQDQELGPGDPIRASVGPLEHFLGFFPVMVRAAGLGWLIFCQGPLPDPLSWR